MFDMSLYFHGTNSIPMNTKSDLLPHRYMVEYVPRRGMEGRSKGHRRSHTYKVQQSKNNYITHAVHVAENVVGHPLSAT